MGEGEVEAEEDYRGQWKHEAGFMIKMPWDWMDYIHFDILRGFCLKNWCLYMDFFLPLCSPCLRDRSYAFL